MMTKDGAAAIADLLRHLGGRDDAWGVSRIPDSEAYCVYGRYYDCCDGRYRDVVIKTMHDAVSVICGIKYQ